MALYHVYNQTVGDGTATSVVRPSDWNSAHSQLVTLSGNTSGASTASGTNIVFQGGNNVTASVNQGANAATIVFSGANTVAQTVQTQPSGNIVGAGFTSTTTAGTAVVATQNSNGLSMGVPTIITNAITTARASNDAVGLNTAGTNVTWTVNSSGISLNAGAYLTTAANSTHSHNFATTTTNGASIVVGTANSAGATIGVPAFLTTARGSTDAVGLNTAQSNATWTVNSSGISFDGRGYAGTGTSATNATLTLNSNGLQISVAGGGVVNQTGPNIAVAGSTVTSGDVVFSNSNGVTFGMNGSTVTASVNAGGGGETLTNYVPYQLGANTTFSSLGQNTVYFQHFIPDEYVTMSKIEMYARGSFVSSSNSQVYAQTVHYGLYSQDTGASSTRMTQISSSSLVYSVSYNSTTAAGFTISQGAGSFTSTTNNTSMLTSVSGPFHLYLPFEGSLAPDVKYAFGIRVSSATTGNTGAHRFAPLALSMMATTNMAKMYTSTVIASANSLVGDRDMGFYATTSASLPVSYATSQLSQVVSRQRFYLQFEQN
jgi:hypothetical protein